jgi:hypothetical protein
MVTSLKIILIFAISSSKFSVNYPHQQDLSLLIAVLGFDWRRPVHATMICRKLQLIFNNDA